MTDFGIFQTGNAQMKKVLELAQSVALTPASLLISGEQGVGKSLLVQFILEKCRFKKTLHRWNKNIQNVTDGDVVLVEAIDELNHLQQNELSEKMDDLKLQGIRARWIATCSHNPNEMVQNQKLRRDLFYRLSVIHLEVPALRQRPEDISILSQFFVQVFSLMKNGEARSLSVEAQAKLLSYSWPGNVCELENVIERAVAMTSESEISLDAIQFSQTSPHLLPTAGATLSEMERKLILQTLQVTQQNKTRAAQILGISIRTLRNKLHEYREAGVM